MGKREKLPTDELLCRHPRGHRWTGTRAEWTTWPGRRFAGWKVSRLIPKGQLRAAVHAFLTAEHDHEVIQTKGSLTAKVVARIAMAVAAGYSEEDPGVPVKPAQCESIGPEHHYFRCEFDHGHAPPHGWPTYDGGRGTWWNDAGQLVEDPRKPAPQEPPLPSNGFKPRANHPPSCPCASIFAAYCGTCGNFIGAETTAAVAKQWAPGHCPPGHSAESVRIVPYRLDQQTKKERAK